MCVDISDFVLFNSRFRDVLIEIDTQYSIEEDNSKKMKRYLEILNLELEKLYTNKERISRLVESMAKYEIFKLIGKIGFFMAPQEVFDQGLKFVNLIIDYLFDDVILLDLEGVCHQLTRFFNYLLIDINNYMNEGLITSQAVELLEKILYLFLNYSIFVNEWIDIVNNNYILVEKQVLKVDVSVLGLGSILEAGMGWKLLPFYSIARNHLSVTNDLTFYNLFLELVRRSFFLFNWCVNSGEFTAFLIQRTKGFLDISQEATIGWIPNLLSIIHKTPDHLKPMLLHDIVDMLEKLYFNLRYSDVLLMIKHFLVHNLDVILIDYMTGFVENFLKLVSEEDGNDFELVQLAIDTPEIDLFFGLLCGPETVNNGFDDPRFDQMMVDVFAFDDDLVISEYASQLILFDNFKEYFVADSKHYLVQKILDSLLKFFMNTQEQNFVLIGVIRSFNLRAKGSVSIFNEDFISIMSFLYESFKWYCSLRDFGYRNYIFFTPSDEFNLTFPVEIQRNAVISSSDLHINLEFFQTFYINTYVNLKLKQQFRQPHTNI